MPRNRIEIWRPESRFVLLAENRTQSIRSEWSRTGLYTLNMLCSSCYLQGVTDAFRAQDVESKKGRK